MSSAGPLVYQSGRFLPQGEAHLSLHDAGFVMGATVTDLCRTFRHRLFRLREHLQRFRYSCLAGQVPQPLSDKDLTQLAEQLVEHNAALLPSEHDLALVMLATPGPIGYYLGEPGGPGEGPPTLAMHTFPLPFARYARLFREGARLVIPSVRHVPAASVDRGIKQRSRLHWWLADREVHRLDPGASALLLDEHGNVTETAAANFLLVRSGEVLSPPRSSILGGISLQVTEELCRKMSIPFREQPLTAEDCRHADEAWLTSTPYGLAGVRQISFSPRPFGGEGSGVRGLPPVVQAACLPPPDQWGGIQGGAGEPPAPREEEVLLSWPGPLMLRLQGAWNDLVGLDMSRQILPDR